MTLSNSIYFLRPPLPACAGQRSWPAVCVALAAAALWLANPLVADAQIQTSTVIEMDGNRLAISNDELRALSDLGRITSSRQRGAQDRALALAKRIATSRDALYALATYELEIGRQRGDDVLRTAALDTLIASPLTRRERLPSLLGVRGQMAYRAGDLDTAKVLWERLAVLAPSDPEVQANLAQVRLAQHDTVGAMGLLTRAITLQKARGQEPSVAWYRQRLSIAEQGNLVAAGIDAAQALVTAAPTVANWRAALLGFRQLTIADGSIEIDVLRLMRHVCALTQPTEYQRLAQLLRQTGEGREARAVLDEGRARGLLDMTTSPTREIAAEVDRAIASGRGGQTNQSFSTEVSGLDGARMQLSLGMARLAVGQRAEAETAFAAAASSSGSGHYADLGSLWQIAMAQNSPGACGPLSITPGDIP